MIVFASKLKTTYKENTCSKLLFKLSFDRLKVNYVKIIFSIFITGWLLKIEKC